MRAIVRGGRADGRVIESYNEARVVYLAPDFVYESTSSVTRGSERGNPYRFAGYEDIDGERFAILSPV